MSEPLVAHGNGTCDVMMLNSGNLPQTIKADWIETHEDDPVVLPILVFVIKHGGKYYLWVSSSFLPSLFCLSFSCFPCPEADDQDLGTRGDFSTSFDPSILARFKRSAPVIHRRLPANLPADCKPLSAVFISHYHWDHCGNPALLPKDVAVWVGRGTLEAIDDGRLGSHAGPAPHEVRERLWEIPEGNVSVLGYEQKGWDVFGDGSFVMLPAPGHCPGHCIAIARVRKDPDACECLRANLCPTLPHHDLLFLLAGGTVIQRQIATDLRHRPRVRQWTRPCPLRTLSLPSQDCRVWPPAAPL